MLMVKFGLLLTFVVDSLFRIVKPLPISSAHTLSPEAFPKQCSLSWFQELGTSSTEANVVRHQGKDRVGAGTMTAASAGKG